MKPALLTQYQETIAPRLRTELKLKNLFQVPRLLKVVVNVGYGKQAKDQAFIDHVEKTLTLITGQKPVHHGAKKSISNFKTREGMKIGVSVTLRGRRMYEFVYKLVHLSLPRVRDFRGLSPKAFDQQGNYTIGFKENLAFPEVRAEAMDKIHGLEVTIMTSAREPASALAFLKALGFPFRQK